MDTLEMLREAIARVYAEWEALPRLPKEWKIVPVMDRAHDRYVLQDLDVKNGGYESRTPAHLEIRDGKIWILTDIMDEGIGTGLLEQGVAKNQIVLAFYPPSVRERGEFAVA